MSRTKKRRHTREWVEYEETGPSRKKKLVDPESYESRKRKALADKKKNKTSYQKDLDSKAGDNGNKGGSHARGRLADKIRKLNAEKEKQDSDT